MMRGFFVALALLATFAASAQTPTILTLSDSAERELVQDRLSVSLRAEATAPTAATAQAEINRRMEAAIARAKTVAGVHVETGGSWAFEERPQNQPRRWRAAATLNLTARGADSAALLVLAGGLQEMGLAMSGLAFDLTRETARAAQDSLTDEALQRLQARAARVAAALDRRVLSIQSVRVGETSGEGRPSPRMALRATAMADAAPAPSAEPGRTLVRVDVEAEILLGPK
jgi:predicted secreted protein